MSCINYIARLSPDIRIIAVLPSIVPGGGGVCLPVTIKDQDNNTLASVASGGTYTVLAFSGIVDNGPPYSNSIVNP